MRETSAARKKRIELLEEEDSAQQRSGPQSNGRGFLRAIVSTVTRSQNSHADTISGLRAEVHIPSN